MPYVDRAKEWRERNADLLKSQEYKEYISAYKREKRQEVQTYVRAIKLSRGCSRCGYKEHHAGLEWHHIDSDKENHVSFCISIKAADREMSKCIVLCANCHKIHHWENKKPLKIQAGCYSPIGYLTTLE